MSMYGLARTEIPVGSVVDVSFGKATFFTNGLFCLSMRTLDGDTPILASAADLTAGRTLANALEAAGITRVDVVGLAESHCVKETALDARKLGYETHVIEELTEPVSEELGVDARRQMCEAGVVLD